METRSRSITEFMTPDPCAIDDALTLQDAAERMRNNDIHHLLVLHGNELVGVVDAHDLDLALAVSGRRTERESVDLAARAPCICPTAASVAEVAGQMQQGRHTCAVIVEDDLAVGIFTLSDALAMLTGEPPTHGLQHEHETRTPEHPQHRTGGARMRVQRILQEHHGAPSSNDGRAFGTVFTG